MNRVHLELCASDEWAAYLRDDLLPWAVDGVTLGDRLLEVGPGPGRTTELLAALGIPVVAAEPDAELAAGLAARLAGPAGGRAPVTVVRADGARLPFAGGSFSGAACLTMLHHVPSAGLQDRLLAEVARVLRPGATLVGVDSLDSEAFRALHQDDVCVPVDPATMTRRLRRAGFDHVVVDDDSHRLRFRGTVAAPAR